MPGVTAMWVVIYILSFIKEINQKSKDLEVFDLEKLVENEDNELQDLWKILEEKLGVSINEFREYIRKKKDCC